MQYVTTSERGVTLMLAKAVEKATAVIDIVSFVSSEHCHHSIAIAYYPT